MSRARYYLFRTLQTVFLLWVVFTFLFFFFRFLPGSYTSLMVNNGASQEAVMAFREQWGLNDPLHVQYWRTLVNFLQLDVGTSIRFRVPVWEYVRMKIFNTVILAVPGITLGYIIGTSIGAVIGERRGSKLERRVIVFLMTFGAFPGFFIAIVLIIVFGVWLDLVPTSGMLSTGVATQYADAPWWRPYLTTDFLMHYILPVSTIALRVVIGPTMVMRTSVVEVMGQDFSYYQRVSGLPYVSRLRHLSRHALLPVVTLYPVSVVRSISGLVLIELVFNWPGIGSALVQSVLSRDFPVVQFIFFITATLVIVANFGVDVLYGIIDPRVSVEES